MSIRHSARIASLPRVNYSGMTVPEKRRRKHTQSISHSDSYMDTTDYMDYMEYMEYHNTYNESIDMSPENFEMDFEDSKILQEREITELVANLELVAKPVTEPMVEPMAEHVTEPVTEPVTESVTEPVTEHVPSQENEYTCYCGYKECGGCGVLSCGCIDVCRGRCGFRDWT